MQPTANTLLIGKPGGHDVESSLARYSPWSLSFLGLPSSPRPLSTLGLEESFSEMKEHGVWGQAHLNPHLVTIIMISCVIWGKLSLLGSDVLICEMHLES